MHYTHDLELFPGARELAQPAFSSDAAYQQFREEFSAIMIPATRDSHRRHALSEHDARGHWVD